MRPTSKRLTYNRLCEVMRYEPSTGHFFWLVDRKFSKSKAGERAGCEHKTGYVQITIDGELHYAHRLAWLYMNGIWPEELIDHVDGIKSNNKWINLRPASYSQNSANRRSRPDKMKGVYINAAGNYVAAIRAGRKIDHLGVFPTPEDAHSAYMAAATIRFGAYARFS